MKNVALFVILFAVACGCVFAQTNEINETSSFMLQPETQGPYGALADCGCNPMWLSAVSKDNNFPVAKFRFWYRPLHVDLAECKTVPPPEVVARSKAELRADLANGARIARLARLRKAGAAVAQVLDEPADQAKVVLTTPTAPTFDFGDVKTITIPRAEYDSMGLALLQEKMANNRLTASLAIRETEVLFLSTVFFLSLVIILVMALSLRLRSWIWPGDNKEFAALRGLCEVLTAEVVPLRTKCADLAKALELSQFERRRDAATASKQNEESQLAMREIAKNSLPFKLVERINIDGVDVLFELDIIESNGDGTFSAFYRCPSCKERHLRVDQDGNIGRLIGHHNKKHASQAGVPTLVAISFHDTAGTTAISA
jgi:hypothetical protein